MTLNLWARHAHAGLAIEYVTFVQLFDIHEHLRLEKKAFEHLLSIININNFCRNLCDLTNHYVLLIVIAIFLWVLSISLLKVKSSLKSPSLICVKIENSQGVIKETINLNYFRY